MLPLIHVYHIHTLRLLPRRYCTTHESTHIHVPCSTLCSLPPHSPPPASAAKNTEIRPGIAFADPSVLPLAVPGSSSVFFLFPFLVRVLSPDYDRHTMLREGILCLTSLFLTSIRARDVPWPPLRRVAQPSRAWSTELPMCGKSQRTEDMDRYSKFASEVLRLKTFGKVFREDDGSYCGFVEMRWRLELYSFAW